MSSRILTSKPHNWQFRLEHGRLIYQIHLIEANDQTLPMIARAVGTRTSADAARVDSKPVCLRVPTEADAVVLRQQDCAKKKRVGRASPLCPGNKFL